MQCYNNENICIRVDLHADPLIYNISDTLGTELVYNFCHCTKQWYWSDDQNKWYNVQIDVIHKDGVWLRPQDDDMEIIRQLRCRQDCPTPYNNDCAMCKKLQSNLDARYTYFMAILCHSNWCPMNRIYSR